MRLKKNPWTCSWWNYNGKRRDNCLGIPWRLGHRLLLPQNGAGLRKEQGWPSIDVAGNYLPNSFAGGIGIPWGEINPIIFWFVAMGTYVLLGLNFNLKGMFQLWHLQSLPFVPWMGADCHVLVYFHSFLKSPIIIHYSQRIVGFIRNFFRIPSLRSWSCSCRTNNRSRFRIRPPYGKGKQSC